MSPRAFRFAVTGAFVAFVGSQATARALPADGAEVEPLDATQVVTAEACRECHVSAYEVWKTTTHATGFKTLHRQQNAAEIAERMGFRLIKRDSLCLDCHYTPIEEGGERRADSGVSCESCHGAGRGYLNVHNDYGGKGLDHDSETPEHRRQRIAKSLAAGMRRPSDLYALASSCYACHSVPNEKLINVGRHSLGSADFELAAWTQGEMRHNFLASMLDGDGTVNATRSVEHQRRLVVLGRMLAVEFALRGLAAATEDGVFLKAGQTKLRRATSDLRQIALVAGIDEAARMVAEVRGVQARLGRRDQLLTAADHVAALGRGFLQSHDGTRLASLDPLLEGKELPFVDDEGDEEDEDSVAVADAADAGHAGDSQPPDDRSASATAGAGSVATASSSSRSSAIPAVGDKRSHIRKVSSHATVDVTACQKCHGDQNAWWFQDRHYASIEPFLDRGDQQTKIARLYGLSPSKMAASGSLCMDCHGTAAQGAREFVDGVSCQSCHGPAADYLDIHQAQEGEALGPQRPGYLKALKLGMNDMRNLETAVRGCASCHYVTDPRLISSGHQSGLDFDIVAGMAKTRHWREAVEPAARLQQVWQAVLAERGAVPDVRLARLADDTPRAAPSGGRGAATTAAGARSTTIPGDQPDRLTFRPRPADPRQAQKGGGRSTTALPELPTFADDTPIEDVLLLLKLQLERLYQALGGPSRASDGGGR